MALTPVITAHWDEPDSFTLDAYKRHGGYSTLTQALKKMGHDPAKDFNDRLIAYMTQQAGPASQVSIRPLSMDDSASPRP